MPVPCGPRGVIRDYIGFYFGPRSPMLYRIHTGYNVHHVDQSNIVYLVSTAQMIADAGIGFVFTDRHSLARVAEFKDRLDDLTMVDFTVAYAEYWRSTPDERDRQEKKQAEFLVHQTVPWELMTGIAVLNDDAEALVNTVNCVGVMGKGIALQFKQAYPEMNDAYEEACKRGEVQPGRMTVWETNQLTGPKYVINFPTKRHWVGRSSYKDIESGLAALVEEIRKRNIRSIAIPPLGCGNGGLKWSKVRPMIEAVFAALPDVRVHLYTPAGAPSSDQRVIRTQRPRMTRARALFLLAMERYAVLAYESTQLEMQKLAYFLQEAGEPLRLRYTAQRYGPYAENLNKVLEDMEGHLISGFDGSRSPDRVISLREGATAEGAEFLKDDAAARARVKRLGELIEGFETPYGMELLASVHWVATHKDPPAGTPEEAIAAISDWSERKAKGFSAEHIRKAWRQLVEHGWIAAPAMAR